MKKTVQFAKNSLAQVGQHIKRNGKTYVVLAISGATMVCRAAATADADVTALTENATATFGVVKTAAISFITFGVGVGLAKRFLSK